MWGGKGRSFRREIILPKQIFGAESDDIYGLNADIRICTYLIVCINKLRIVKKNEKYTCTFYNPQRFLILSGFLKFEHSIFPRKYPIFGICQNGMHYMKQNRSK